MVLFMSAPLECVSGEIVPVSALISPDEASLLGDTVLALFEERRQLENTACTHGQINWFEGGEEKSYLAPSPTGGAREIALGSSDYTIVCRMLERFNEEVAQRSGDEAWSVDGHFFVGTAGKSLWHIDPGEHFRLLGSLTRSTLSLKVGTEWTPEKISDDRYALFLSNPPAQWTKMEYTAGNGLLLDNTVPEPQRTPHAGVDSPGKVYFRGIAVAPLK